MREAAFSLAEAKFTSGDFGHIVLQNVNKAQLKVRSKRENVAGLYYLVLLISTYYIMSIIVADNVFL